MTNDRGHAQDAHQRHFTDYFGAWARALQQAVGPVAGTAGGPDGLAGAAGGPWLQAIHQLAQRALEQDLDSAGIAAAWRAMLQEGLWPDVPTVQGMFGVGETPWNLAGGAWLEHPALGPLREHVERWQHLGQQQRQSQAALADWQALLTKVRELALAQFEQLLRAHEQRPLADARALLDLWVDAAERAWQEVAMGEEFARLLAQLNQSQMHLLQAQQAEAERVYGAMGIATRRELDQAYARIDALERQLREVLAQQAPRAPAAGTAKRGKAAAAGTKTAGKPRPAAGRKATDPGATSPPAVKAARKAASKAANKRPMRGAEKA